MADFLYDPPLPEKPAKALQPITQIIRLMQDKTEIAIARWHASDPATGVVQLIDLTVHAPYRRIRHGKRVMTAIVAQCHAWHASHGHNLRRIWMTLRQKEQVIARAFFVQNGFTHTGTIKELLCDEDALVYFRTFD